MSKPKKEESLDQWIDDLAEAMATESVQILITQGKLKGEGVCNVLASRYVARFMALSVWATLNTQPQKEMNNKDLCNFTMQNYRSMKVSYQEAIAAGFQSAFTKFTKRPVSYFCQITPVPEPINKLPA